MRTKMFGPLLSLCLAATTLPLAGCDSVFASWLRYGDTSGDGGPSGSEDLAGADLTGADLAGLDLAKPPVICDNWPTDNNATPWHAGSELFTHTTNIGTPSHRIAVGDYDGDGLLDIAVASTGTGGTQFKVYRQFPACTFSSTPITTQAFNSHVGIHDFAAFRNNKNGQWDFVLIDSGNNMAWCNQEYGAANSSCIATSAIANIAVTVPAGIPKAIVADRRGRSIAGSVLIHQKGLPDALIFVKRPDAGGTLTARMATNAMNEPGHATVFLPNWAPKQDSSPPAIAAATLRSSDNRHIIVIYDIDEGMGALVPRMSLSSANTNVNGTYNVFEGYLYPGRFASDPTDDILALNRGNSMMTRYVATFEYTSAATPPTTAAVAANALSGYDRDAVMFRNLDGDPANIDELVVMTNVNVAQNARFSSYRRQGGTTLTAITNGSQDLGSPISDFAIATIGQDHARPDLVYIDRTNGRVIVRRGNAGFNYVP